MVMGVVLATAAAVSAFEDPKPTAAGCSVCATQMECPAMQGGARFELLDLEYGAAMLITISDPEQVALFHQNWDRCKAEIDRANKLPKEEARSQLCGLCYGYYDLVRQGARHEFVKTENGALCLMTGKKAKVVQAIHQHTATVREMMAKKVPCCGSP
jgi:hypothetical protein